jgi:hypothetical protein
MSVQRGRQEIDLSQRSKPLGQGGGAAGAGLRFVYGRPGDGKKLARRGAAK